jgi:transposase InsO family protein
MDPLTPKHHGEEVAVFRHGLVGHIAVLSLTHGERIAMLRKVSEQCVRPPGSDLTRCYSVPTLERWLYAFKRGGLEALVPRARGDKGRGRDIDPVLRELLCEIRREHPEVGVNLILRTLRADGRIGPRVTACTVRRMFAEKGLHRCVLVDGNGGHGGRTRLKWQAERPSALWHGDVCHGPTLTLGGRRTPVRVHALLDDASRYVVALRVWNNEREESMLSLFTQALMEHGKPDALYLDNGSTYRGAILQLACSRLGITLLHARPYDAPARGKMERFWRRLREEALNHVGEISSLADVEQKLQTWLTRFYQHGPHAGILGRAPATVFAEGDKVRVDTDELRAALTVRTRRRVRRDTTVSVGGVVYEVPFGYLAGHLVTIATCFFDGAAPVLELDGKTAPLRVVDPAANSKTRRPPKRPAPGRSGQPVDFDPGCTLNRVEEDDDGDLF